MSSPDLDNLEKNMLSPLKYCINSLEDFSQNESIEDVIHMEHDEKYIDEHSDVILFSIPPIFMTWSEFNQKRKLKYTVHSYIPSFANFKNYEGKSILVLGYKDGIETIEFAKVCRDITIVCESKLEFGMIRSTFNNLNLTPKLIDIYTSINDLYPVHYDLIYSTGYIGNTCNIRKILSNLQQKHSDRNTELKCIFNSKVSWRHIRTITECDMTNIGSISRKLKSYGNLYSFGELDKIISSAGFNIVAMWKDHILTFNKKDLLNGTLVKDIYWQGVSDDTLHSFKEELGCYTMTISTLKNDGLSLLS